jgi:hypothetical protein
VGCGFNAAGRNGYCDCPAEKLSLVCKTSVRIVTDAMVAFMAIH